MNKELVKQALDKLMAHIEVHHLVAASSQRELEVLVAGLITAATARPVQTDLQSAAQAVLDRWDSPQWKWVKHGPTADLMHDLRRAIEPHHSIKE